MYASRVAIIFSAIFPRQLRSDIGRYATFRHSNPSPSGPGALLDDEDMIASRISFWVRLGHGSRRVGGTSSLPMFAVGGLGKRAVRNNLAFSAKVCARSSPCMMSGVGTVLLGLVYRIAVNISFPFAPCRKSFQFFDFASRMAL